MLNLVLFKLSLAWTDTMPIDDDGDDGDYFYPRLGDRYTKQDYQSYLRHLEERDARMARDRRKDKGAQTDGVGGNQLREASQQGRLTTTNLTALGCDSEEEAWASIETDGNTPEMLELNKKREARNRLHHSKMKIVGVPEKAVKQDASFYVTIRRCGDDGDGKRSRSDGRGVGVNSSGTIYWDTLPPISRKEAETMTLLDL